MRSPFGRAVTVAWYCLVAQLFLQLAALIVFGSIYALVQLDSAFVVMAPVAVFAAYVGLLALRLAASGISGRSPLL